MLPFVQELIRSFDLNKSIQKASQRNSEAIFLPPKHNSPFRVQLLMIADQSISKMLTHARRYFYMSLSTCELLDYAHITPRVLPFYKERNSSHLIFSQYFPFRQSVPVPRYFLALALIFTPILFSRIHQTPPFWLRHRVSKFIGCINP